MSSASEISQLAEGCELECKLAAGKDGRGELPQSFFPTYSAMANTAGGVVLLGVQEKPPGQFITRGVVDHDRVRTHLWTQLNNREKVSVNLLADEHVQVVRLDGMSVIRVRVPRASRRERPVYLDRNPLTGTYRRYHEGDHLCDADTVRRMLAEQVEDARDARVLHGFGMEDLDATSLAAFRNRLRSHKPTHPFLDADDLRLLEQLGGWARDRDTGREGLTLAGLLMFGRFRPIHDAVPTYLVDYQEWPSDPTGEGRWADRVTTDGTWSGNLFDFFRLVYPRLTADLKVPFRLVGDTRVDDTPVHEAIREALVNTLIHADYACRSSVLVVKRADLFGFRNPGLMRVPVELAIRGGDHDCRNRSLQKMFFLAGLGDQAGSGLPKIYRNWRQSNWRPPELWELADREQTLMALRPISLLPPPAVEAIEQRYGGRLGSLTEAQRLVLATVAVEGHTSHARMKSITGLHPVDLSKQLAELVDGDYLAAEGYSHGRRYFFPGEVPAPTGATLDVDAGPRLFGGDLFRHLLPPTPNPVPNGPNPVPNGPNPVPNGPNPVPNGPNPVPNGPNPVPDRPSDWEPLWVLAEPIRASERTQPAAVREMIQALCRGRFLSRQQLALLLGRGSDKLRINYLTPLVGEGKLTLLYPDNKSHPGQKYRTADA